MKHERPKRLDWLPNVVVATDGTVLATRGGRPANHSFLVRRSEDGGKTWPIKRLVEEGHFAYSSLAGGHPNSAGHARFNLARVLEGHDLEDLLTDTQ
jgi:hypothetical protein